MPGTYFFSIQNSINMFIINLFMPSFKDGFMFSHLHFWDHSTSVHGEFLRSVSGGEMSGVSDWCLIIYYCHHATNGTRNVGLIKGFVASRFVSFNWRREERFFVSQMDIKSNQANDEKHKLHNRKRFWWSRAKRERS